MWHSSLFDHNTFPPRTINHWLLAKSTLLDPNKRKIKAEHKYHHVKQKYPNLTIRITLFKPWNRRPIRRNIGAYLGSRFSPPIIHLHQTPSQCRTGGEFAQVGKQVVSSRDRIIVRQNKRTKNGSPPSPRREPMKTVAHFNLPNNFRPFSSREYARGSRGPRGWSCPGIVKAVSRPCGISRTLERLWWSDFILQFLAHFTFGGWGDCFRVRLFGVWDALRNPIRSMRT